MSAARLTSRLGRSCAASAGARASCAACSRCCGPTAAACRSCSSRCVLATAAALAPPYLAGRAIDDGIRGGDLGALDVIVVLFLLAAVDQLGRDLRADLPRQLGRPARAPGPAAADLRAPPALSIGFYSRNKAGVLISRMTNDVQALDQLVTDGIVTLFSSTLTLLGTAAILFALDPELALVTFADVPDPARSGRSRSGSRRRAPTALTREKIAVDHRVPAGDAVGHPRSCARSARRSATRSSFAELNDENREANMRTVYLNAAYFPSVELLSAVATAVILLYGGNQVRRRRRRDDRRARLVRLLPADLLRPDPAALAALHDLPVRAWRRSTRSSSCSTRSPTCVERPDAARAAARARRDPLRRRVVRLRQPTRTARVRAARRRPDGPARADRRAGRRHRRRQVDAREAGRALLRPDPRPRAGRRPRPARRHRAVAALAARHRAAGGLPVLRHDRRQHRLRAPGRDRRGGRRGGARGRRRRVHRAAARRLRHRGRRARRAPVGRPAPARGVRARGGRRPAHPDPRRGDVERRRPHRGADRARPAPPARRPHGDRDRAPPVDDPRRRPDRRARRTGGSSSRARTTSCSPRTARTRALYRDWAEQAAA